MNKCYLLSLLIFKNYLSVLSLSSFFYMSYAQESTTKTIAQPLPVGISDFFSSTKLNADSFIIQFPANWYTLHNQITSSRSALLKPEDDSASIPQKFKDLGAPELWHEGLGISRDNYEKYLELWNKKTLQNTGNYQILIEPTETTSTTQTLSNGWLLRLIGEGRYSRLVWIYQADTQSWQSPNMRLNYLGEMNTHKQSILGKWSGKIWQNSRNNSQGTWIETLAFGKDANNKTVMVYRTQAINPQQELWFDESLILRSE